MALQQRVATQKAWKTKRKKQPLKMIWLTHPPEEVSAPLKAWLTHSHSLTQRLKSACDEFGVRILKEAWGSASTEEYTLLGSNSNERIQTREVHLCCNGTPWVYSKTLFPESALNDKKTKLLNLGEKPLGEVLFANPNTKRGPIGFKRLHKEDTLYQNALKNIDSNPDVLWARRSVFTIENKNLLVYEVFLPEFKA